MDEHRLAARLIWMNSWRFGVQGLSEADVEHFNRAWHRRRPGPAVRGLARLKKKTIIATLSNGNAVAAY